MRNGRRPCDGIGVKSYRRASLFGYGYPYSLGSAITPISDGGAGGSPPHRERRPTPNPVTPQTAPSAVALRRVSVASADRKWLAPPQLLPRRGKRSNRCSRHFILRSQHHRLQSPRSARLAGPVNKPDPNPDGQNEASSGDHKDLCRVGACYDRVNKEPSVYRGNHSNERQGQTNCSPIRSQFHFQVVERQRFSPLDSRCGLTKPTMALCPGTGTRAGCTRRQSSVRS